MFTNEFVGEGSFLLRSTAAALFNVDPKNRKKISAEVNNYKNIAERIEFGVRDAFEPGFAREVTKFQQAQRGQGELTTGDVARRQIGVRLNSFKVDESAMFRIKEFVENSQLVASRYYSARDYAKKSPEEVAAIYQESNATHKANMQEVIKKVNSLRALNLSEDEIIKILGGDGARLGNSAILDTLDGKVSDIPLVKRVTPTGIWEEKISILPRAEQMQEIQRISRADPSLGKSLMSMARSEQLAKQRGITSRDSLIMNLGVSDGTRAGYIYKQSIGLQNPDAYIQGMARKGIVTPEVFRQIKLLQQANQ